MTEEDRNIERTIGKHVHDVRNSMNCIYWEAVLLGEVSTDPEVKAAVKRMNDEIAQMEATLKALQYRFSEPAPVTLTSAQLLSQWQEQIAPLETSDRRISWASQPEPMDLTLDAPAMISVMRELILDAWKRTPGSELEAAISIKDESVAMELHEPVSSSEIEPVELEERQQFVARHGGVLVVGEHAGAEVRVITLSFPAP